MLASLAGNRQDVSLPTTITLVAVKRTVPLCVITLTKGDLVSEA